MTGPATAPIVVNGWSVFLHPLFLDQLESLLDTVETLKKKDPQGYTGRNATKRLAAIARLAFEVIPRDPAAPEYRQGDTLGPEHRHWFRAKFFQQYRLFFRYDARSKMIIYAWVNDEDSKRAYGSRTDAYLVFNRMLTRGTPPDAWTDLIAEARRSSGRAEKLTRRMAGLGKPRKR
jgi:toxin YhaV